MGRSAVVSKVAAINGTPLAPEAVAPRGRRVELGDPSLVADFVKRAIERGEVLFDPH